MRLAFFLLTLVLIGVVGWAAWNEVHPQWRRYQRILRERSEARLLVEHARAILYRYDVHAYVGGGTNIYFTELNRERPDPRPARLMRGAGALAAVTIIGAGLVVYPPAVAVVPLPAAPPIVLGVISLRGEIIAVVASVANHCKY